MGKCFRLANGLNEGRNSGNGEEGAGFQSLKSRIDRPGDWI